MARWMMCGESKKFFLCEGKAAQEQLKYSGAERERERRSGGEES